MISQDIPNKQEITLYEAIHHYGKDQDIADTIFDFAVYFSCAKSWEKCRDDDYEKCMLLFALNIKVESINQDYTICKITDFIEEHRKEFDDFFNEVHKEQWQPRNMKAISCDDEEYYDFYIMCFESLVAGNYGEKDYTRLYEILTKGK